MPTRKGASIAMLCAATVIADALDFDCNDTTLEPRLALLLTQAHDANQSGNMDAYSNLCKDITSLLQQHLTTKGETE